MLFLSFIVHCEKPLVCAIGDRNDGDDAREVQPHLITYLSHLECRKNNDGNTVFFYSRGNLLDCLPV